MVFRNSTHASFPGKILGCGHLFSRESHVSGCQPRPCLQKILGSWGTVLSCLEKIRCRIPTPSRPHPRLWPTESRCLLWSQLLGESRLEKSPLVVSLCVTYFLICFSSSRPWGVVWIYFFRYRETRFWKKNHPRLLGVDVRCHTSGLRKNNLPVVCR